MIYVAMFDELDEGTCIFKCANSKNTPIFATSSDPQGKFLGIDDDLPTDYYLFLAGQAGEWLKGNAEYGDTKPSYKPMGVEQVTDDSPVNVSYANNILTIKTSRTGKCRLIFTTCKGFDQFVKNTDNGIPFNKTIDISSLPKGVYIIQIVLMEKYHCKKIQNSRVTQVKLKAKISIQEKYRDFYKKVLNADSQKRIECVISHY